MVKWKRNFFLEAFVSELVELCQWLLKCKAVRNSLEITREIKYYVANRSISCYLSCKGIFLIQLTFCFLSLSYLFLLHLSINCVNTYNFKCTVSLPISILLSKSLRYHHGMLRLLLSYTFYTYTNNFLIPSRVNIVLPNRHYVAESERDAPSLQVTFQTKHHFTQPPAGHRQSSVAVLQYLVFSDITRLVIV